MVGEVKDVAVFDEDRNIYITPSLALTQGHSLKKTADILECEAKMAESDHEEFLKNLKSSRSLYDKKWDVCVVTCLTNSKRGEMKHSSAPPFH